MKIFVALKLEMCEHEGRRDESRSMGTHSTSAWALKESQDPSVTLHPKCRELVDGDVVNGE